MVVHVMGTRTFREDAGGRTWWVHALLEKAHECTRDGCV